MTFYVTVQWKRSSACRVLVTDGTDATHRFGGKVSVKKACKLVTRKTRRFDMKLFTLY